MADRSVARFDLLSDHFLGKTQSPSTWFKLVFWTNELNFGQNAVAIRVLKFPLGRQIAALV
jgi:hypothetical protein